MKRMKLTTAGRVVIFVIVLALLAGIGGFGYNYYKNNIADKKEAAAKEKKKAQREAQEKRAEEKKADRTDKKGKTDGTGKAKDTEKTSDADKVTVSASSWEELLKKIDNVIYESRADSVMTKEEKAVGQSFDYSI